MGRINFIWKPKDWKIDIEGINKNIPNDIVYRMIIGCGDDEGYYEIYEFISKANYENIINNNTIERTFQKRKRKVKVVCDSRPITD